MKEVWKPIKGYEGLYEVSNLGRVKSLSRNMEMPHSGTRKKSEKILKPFVNLREYLCVDIYKGKRNNCRIHLIVWDHFGNRQRNGHKLQVDHKDNNKQNNQISNLQLLTNRQNVSKGYQQKGTSYPTGVYWHKPKKKYRAVIYINGKSKHLGSFNDPEEASAAYQKALAELVRQTPDRSQPRREGGEKDGNS